jgi:hypothetical protein
MILNLRFLMCTIFNQYILIKHSPREYCERAPPLAIAGRTCDALPPLQAPEEEVNYSYTDIPEMSGKQLRCYILYMVPILHANRFYNVSKECLKRIHNRVSKAYE